MEHRCECFELKYPGYCKQADKWHCENMLRREVVVVVGGEGVLQELGGDRVVVSGVLPLQPSDPPSPSLKPCLYFCFPIAASQGLTLLFSPALPLWSEEPCLSCAVGIQGQARVHVAWPNEKESEWNF